MARVNVEQQALTDSRFRILGELLGGDHRLALGHMIYVWHECLQRSSYVLTERELRSLTDCDDFAKFLIDSGLGERCDGGIRIRGTKGRIEWLGAARDNGKKGGRPPKKSAGESKKTARKASGPPGSPADEEDVPF